MPSFLEVLEKSQAEAHYRGGGAGELPSSRALLEPSSPTGDQQSAAAARWPSGVMTCVLSVLGWRESGEV